ncbi:MAG: hypothetical protein U5P10_04045 [Spirochaetia bacterium]|nr:hypothetical protein [Spirochaetia bacterium]
MNRFGKAGRLLAFTTEAIIGTPQQRGLSGVSIDKAAASAQLLPAIDLMRTIAGGSYRYQEKRAETPLEEFVRRGVENFLRYYSRPEQAEKVDGVLELFESGVNQELLAEAISKVWMPELELDDREILPRWQLTNLRANPEPIKPTEVVLQLNALYTLPEAGAAELEGLPAQFKSLVQELRSKPGEKVADYDHPVPLYEEDSHHELVSCLQELEGDAAFEKQQGVLPADYRVPVLLSVSVTHAGLDKPAGRWIEWLLQEKQYHHLQVLVLTEERVRGLKAELLKGAGEDPGGRSEADAADDPLEVFSVFGKYGRHFNALKYSQLILEKTHNIRAGFKLDTDEGIRSRNLHEATGLTWFQTLCHPYWGGEAEDLQGRAVELAVNEGEYMNSTDIDKLGFAKAMRAPDVAIPNTWTGPNMFFQKSFAHGRMTALYNSINSLEAGISHPVVKGGGYGISNHGLQHALPFTFSWVGRAEDQQFYFSGLPYGIRALFHPDLRIAHYKSAVSGAEEKTAATRFIGDMYRLLIFQRLADMLEVKEQIDPMPGVFAGELARAQAVFASLLKACEFAVHKNEPAAGYIIEQGLAELLDLEDRIDRGEVDAGFRRERAQWSLFVKHVEAADGNRLKKIFNLL